MIDEKTIATVEELDRRYREKSVILLARIAKRDEVKSLLKIANPAQISSLREVISSLDKMIEKIEREMEMIAYMQNQRLQFDKSIREMDTMSNKLKPEILDFIAFHHHSKPEEIQFMLRDEDAAKTH